MRARSVVWMVWPGATTRSMPGRSATATTSMTRADDDGDHIVPWRDNDGDHIVPWRDIDGYHVDAPSWTAAQSCCTDQAAVDMGEPDSSPLELLPPAAPKTAPEPADDDGPPSIPPPTKACGY